MDDRIRRFQKGSAVPKSAVKKVTALWSRDVTKKFEDRKAILEQDKKHRQRLTSKLFEALSNDKEVLGAQKGIRELALRYDLGAKPW
jgi:hypothetical protein